jgi:WhiB family redox-sensing transcriptional regulator
MTYDTALAQTATNGPTSFLESIIKPESWVKSASCAQIGGDFWFPEGKGTQNNEAKAICRACPARAACLEYAMRTNQTEGIWGATTPFQRANMRRAS